MEIRIRETGAVMYESELRHYLRDNNGPSYDTLTTEVMEIIGVDPVFEGPQATGGTVYQYSQRAGVEEINGVWYTKYVLGPTFTDITQDDGSIVTAAEQEAAYKSQKDDEQASRIRLERTRLLSETDWRYRRDLTTSPEWDMYCQALRDITEQPGFPWNVEWPITPT